MVPKLCPGGCFSSTTSTTATCETRDATIRTDPTTTSTRGVDGKKPLVAWSTNNCTLTLEVQHGILQCRWFQLVFGCKYNLFNLIPHVLEGQTPNLLNRSNVKTIVFTQCFGIWPWFGMIWVLLFSNSLFSALGGRTSLGVADLRIVWWCCKNHRESSETSIIYDFFSNQHPETSTRDCGHCCQWNPNNLSHAAQPCIECQSPSGQRMASEDWYRRLGTLYVHCRYIPASTIRQ